MRGRRALGALAVAALSVPAWGVPGGLAQSAQSAQEAPSVAAYFSSTGIAKPDESPAAPPNVTASADGVAPGNLAVAARAGMTDKASFLLFPLAAAPAGATITRAVLTVPLAQGNGNVSAAAAAVKVRACAIDDTGFGDEDGAALSLAPQPLCDTFAATATESPDQQAYLFDITGLAAGWLDRNDGIGLFPNEGADTTPFQVVFGGLDQVSLSYSFTAPAPEQSVPTAPLSQGGGVGQAPPLSTFDSGGFDAGSADSFGSTSGGGGFASGPQVADVPAVQTPVTDPAVAAPAPEAAPVAVTRASRVVPAAPLRPSIGGWLGAALLVAVVALLSLILGDSRVPAVTTQSTSRLSQALRARQSAAARPAGLKS